MKIESVIITNFRSIKNAVIRMHDITAIVGENNAGKTAVLRALNSVMNFKEEEENFINYRHRFAPRCNTHIRVVFTDVPFRPQIHPRCNIRPKRCTTGDQGMLLFGILVYL